MSEMLTALTKPMVAARATTEEIEHFILINRLEFAVNE
jgi:hypothetical protein